MRDFSSIRRNLLYVVVALIFISGCSGNTNKNNSQMNDSFTSGTYGYDVNFFAKKNIPFIELKGNGDKSRILIVPGYQGRVMTSSVAGNEGASFGWINYRFIEAGKQSSQFNPYGGEERIWFGPEGGPFSIYFKPGTEQVFANWIVPKEIDTEPFEIVSRSDDRAAFKREFSLINASGTKMDVAVERNIKLLGPSEAENALGFAIDRSLSFVGYESENILLNKGAAAWDEKSGALSVWMLAMFNPSPSGIVFIPFKKGSVDEKGTIVNDDYFGKVPADRLIVQDGILFFRVDGKHRSKIGITPLRALPFCGSYDPDKKVITLLWYSAPETPSKYVNSKWGKQDDPFKGDVVNSYNDGPVEDGSIMGPFYEIESSSPAAFLAPGGRITHRQRIFHITGDEQKLTEITEKIFGQKLSDISSVF